MSPESSQLPREIADRFTGPFARFLKVESATGVLLLLATAVALILSNSPLAAVSSKFWETPVGLHFGALDFTRSLRHWINDGVMTLFFFVVALELKRELVHGELRSVRTAAFSFAGALGGMLVPAGVYLALMHDEPGVRGWGTVMATDTAFVIGGLALLGSRIPSSLRLFLLSLAIFDDVGAILVVAIGYGGALSWTALAVVAALVVAVLVGTRIGIRGVAVYVFLGAGLWLALDASGIHPTLAGVILGMMTPAREWVSNERLHAIFERVLSHPKGRRRSGNTTDRADLQRAGLAAREALSPVERLEMRMHPWSGFVIMPVFALANAGVTISWTKIGDPVTGAVVAGLVLGKPVGVVSLSWLAVRLGVATRPNSLKWSVLAAGSLLTGIGFTMALFIAGLAFGPDMLGAAKVGILGAFAVAGTAGLLMLFWLTSIRRSSSEAAETGQ
jgi:NhaA family Na+:H+ antiporter